MKALLFILCFVSAAAQAERWVVEIPQSLSETVLKHSLQADAVERFAPGHSRGPFAHLWVVEGAKLNLRHKLVKKAERSFGLTLSSIVPNPRGERLVADMLFGYQWALYNQGQIIQTQLDSLTLLPVTGKRGEDLNWKSILPLTVLGDVRPLVAVVDTGVDLKHPELQHALEKNSKECDSNDPTVDSDGNGFPGDCMGWNFTAPLKSAEARNPQDLAGHGTHLAGAIAAKRDDKGITGLVPGLRILAVKVLNDGETESADDGTRLPMSDRLARGIIYAVDRGADVVNLSLGWPRSLETDYLRQAVAYALQKGVLLVAAAGNNNSAEPIFPCAIDGVVCVGATNADGAWAGFSNYGSHVDILAPGVGILSTYPTDLDPELFNVPGYEIKNGTSQAAPYITAALALLKARAPELSSEQLIAKLVTSTRSAPNDAKYSMTGGLDMSLLLDGQSVKPSVRPQFKLLRQLIYAIGDDNKTFTLPLKNIGASAQDVVVSVETDAQAIRITDGPIRVGMMGEGESRPLTIHYRMEDLDAHSQINLLVRVKHDGAEYVYRTEVPLVRDFRRDGGAKTRPFRFTGPKLPVGQFKDGIVSPLIIPVDELHPSGKQEFILKRIITEPKAGEEAGVNIILFRTQGDEVLQAETNIFMKDAIKLINFTRMDVNYDGVEDYFVQFGFKDNDSEWYKFAYYSADLTPLFGAQSFWDFHPEVTLIDAQTLRFMAQDVPGLGKVAVPVFARPGRLPKIDQDPSPWVRPDNTVIDRLYFLLLQPGVKENNVQTRSLTTQRFTEMVLQRFGLGWKEGVDFVDMLAQPKSRYMEGKVDALFSLGRGMFRRLMRLSLSSPDQFEWTPYTTDNIRLEGLNRQDTLDLTRQEYYHGGDTWVGIDDDVTAHLFSYDGEGLNPIENSVIRHDSRSDSLLSHLATFREAEGWSHFLESKSRLLLERSTPRGVSHVLRPILRFSFLPGKQLSELYYPVYVQEDGVKHAALYVDTTQITANRVHILVANDQGLVAPARHSLLVPNNCKTMTPLMSPSRDSFQYNLLCADPEGWALKSLELK